MDVLKIEKSINPLKSKLQIFFFVNVYSPVAPIIALTAECKNSSLADTLPGNVYLRKEKSNIQGQVLFKLIDIYEVLLLNRDYFSI